MSLNVERVGNLMVQHYVEDVVERSHVRLVSQSDSIGPDVGSRVKIVVIWAFTGRPSPSSGDETGSLGPIRERRGQLPTIHPKTGAAGMPRGTDRLIPAATTLHVTTGGFSS